MTTTYEDLRSQFVNGEASVTAAELDKARRDAEFEALKDEAAEAAATREAEAQRERELEDLREQILKLQSKGTDHLRQAYADLVASGLVFRAALEQRRADISGLNAVLVKHDAHEELPEDYNVHAYIDRATEEIRVGHPITLHRLSPEA